MTVLLLIAAGTTDTRACPPGPCNKYRQRLPALEPQIQTYRRAIRSTLPPRYTRAMLQRFLAGAAWQPIAIAAVPANNPSLPARTIRFVDPARVERRAETTDRIVLLRQLERRADTMYVEIDGVFFALSYCRDGRFTNTCLDRVGALPAEADEQHRFATPP